MTIGLLTHATAGGINGATTGAIDTTGASLLVIEAAFSTGSVTVSDSKSNTWTALTESSYTSTANKLYYAENPTVGTGHTFTISGTGLAPSIVASAWSGVKTASPLDSHDELATPGAQLMIAPGLHGPFTPSEAGCLVLCGVNISGDVTSLTARNGYAIADSIAFGTGDHYGAAIVYAVQTTATLVDNDITVADWTTARTIANGVAVFKAGVATQVLAPASDIATNGWQSSLGGALYAAIDEASADDADYIYSPDDPTSQEVEIKLSAGGDPASSTGHIVSLRLQAMGLDTNFDINLVQGGTVLDAWTETVTVAEGATTRSRTLSGGVADAITDYTDIRIRVMARA